MRWKKTIVYFDGNEIKIYVNKIDTRAIVFPPFGRYFSILSDRSALDLTVTFIFQSPTTEVTYTQYLSGQENTDIIHQDAA